MSTRPEQRELGSSARGNGQWLALLLIIFSGAVTALGDTASAPSVPLTAPSMGMSLVRMIGALALVFAIFLGGLWLFKNWQRLIVQRGQSPKLNIIEVKSLGHRHALYVVGYEQQRMLLAASPNGVTMLTQLAAAERDAVLESTVVPQTKFTDALHAALTRKP